MLFLLLPFRFLLYVDFDDDNELSVLLECDVAKLQKMYGLWSTKSIDVDLALYGKFVHTGKALPVSRTDG